MTNKYYSIANIPQHLTHAHKIQFQRIFAYCDSVALNDKGNFNNYKANINGNLVYFNEHELPLALEKIVSFMDNADLMCRDAKGNVR